MNDKCFSMASRGRMDSESIAMAPDHAIDFGRWYGLPLLYGENKRSENDGPACPLPGGIGVFVLAGKKRKAH